MVTISVFLMAQKLSQISVSVKKRTSCIAGKKLFSWPEMDFNVFLFLCSLKKSVRITKV